MWTNEGTLIRLAWHRPFLSSAGGWAGRLRVFGDNALFLGVTGSPAPCLGSSWGICLGGLGAIPKGLAVGGHLWTLLVSRARPCPWPPGTGADISLWLCPTGSCSCP